jgi:hypothetical protein
LSFNEVQGFRSTNYKQEKAVLTAFRGISFKDVKRYGIVIRVETGQGQRHCLSPKGLGLQLGNVPIGMLGCRDGTGRHGN